MEEYITFMDWESQYCTYASSPQISLHIYKYSIILAFLKNWQADFKICLEMKRTRNSQEYFL